MQELQDRGLDLADMVHVMACCNVESMVGVDDDTTYVIRGRATSGQYVKAMVKVMEDSNRGLVITILEVE